MSAIAYAYSIYPGTRGLVWTIAERQNLGHDTSPGHRLTLRDNFERHIVALSEVVPRLGREALEAAMAAASLEPDRIDPAAVRRAIAANPLGGVRVEDVPEAAIAFESTLATGLAAAGPAVEAVIRDIILGGPVPHLAVEFPLAVPTPPVPAPSPRLAFDDQTRTVRLDSVPDGGALPADVYAFLKAIGDGGRCGRMVRGREILNARGMTGKKLSRVVGKLPGRWKSLVTSQKGTGGGYCLTLPTGSCP